MPSTEREPSNPGMDDEGVSAPSCWGDRLFGKILHTPEFWKLRCSSGWRTSPRKSVELDGAGDLGSLTCSLTDLNTWLAHLTPQFPGL